MEVVVLVDENILQTRETGTAQCREVFAFLLACLPLVF
jgi:hypothetical protein